MSEEFQTELTLNDVAEFHQQLLRLHAAGLKLQLEDDLFAQNSLSHGSLAESLNKIMAGLASRANKSTELSKTVREAEFLPARYRLALQTWHTCGGSVESLAMLRAPVQKASEGQADFRYALLLPSIVLVLIYCFSFYLLMVTVPRMELIYAQLNSPPSLPVQWLIAIRSAMPYWGPGIPLLVALVWVGLIAGRLNWPRWLPGRSQSSRYLAASLLARNLAAQIEQSGHDPAVGTLAIADGLRSAPVVKQSPMLRWALSKADALPVQPDEQLEQPEPVDPTIAAQQQSRRLRLSAGLYETMQAIYAQQFRVGITLFMCIVLGGGLTLLYSLALFVPLVQLLNDIVGK